MAGPSPFPIPAAGLQVLAPRERIVAVADAGSVAWLDTPRRSPHLARFGISAQDDDGIATAAVRIHGTPVFVAAQDERFLRGSVGAGHAHALAALFRRARAKRWGVALLMASGGVRLHEANAAELALARALSALFDARAAEVPVAALAVGDVFGGASVLACAGAALGMLPGARLGLSGPKVIETARGRSELDAADRTAVDALFGAAARVAHGHAALVQDDAHAVREWLHMALQPALPFEAHVLRAHEGLATRAAVPAAGDGHAPSPHFASLAGAVAEDRDGWLWRFDGALFTRPFTGRPFDGVSVHALDTALLAAHAAARRSTLVLTEDSTGHDVSRAAEARVDSTRLAHHAAVLALLRARGVRIVGWLCGTGHSAAFFVNALQAPRLVASPHARVVAMDPAAIARVTGREVHALVDDDPLLGQPARHLAALGGVDAFVADAAALRAELRR